MCLNLFFCDFGCLLSCFVQALGSHVGSSVANAESQLLIGQSSLKAGVEEQRTYVTTTVTSFTESTQQLADKLALQTRDVDCFLSSELKQDVPTGTSFMSSCN